MWPNRTELIVFGSGSKPEPIFSVRVRISNFSELSRFYQKGLVSDWESHLMATTGAVEGSRRVGEVGKAKNVLGEGGCWG